MHSEKRKYFRKHQATSPIKTFLHRHISVQYRISGGKFEPGRDQTGHFAVFAAKWKNEAGLQTANQARMVALVHMKNMQLVFALI